MPAIEVIPSARRLIRSLRDMGYDFCQAVADIIDNSIEAQATSISIDVEFDGDDSWVRIADNGRGMTPEQLREAMRYGAERDYHAEDLGKFGLGLKTASMSQCQRLSVASRWNPARADITAYSWDLAHIERTNRWEILPADQNGLGSVLRQPLKENTGTVVLWQRLDRILGYRHPYGETARKRLAQMCRELENHIGMVFHRFLSGEVGGKPLRILLNGSEIRPWDPFCRSEPKTRVLQPVRIEIEHEGVAGEVLLQPYILPHQDDFSSLEAFRAASGPANWNQQQGFYIYRAERMIQSGGWCRLHAPDEHMKLARIAVHFSPQLDEAFKINVAKMRVQLPSQIREDVRKAIAPVRKLAREVYDRKNPSSRAAAATPGRTGADSVRSGTVSADESARPICSPTPGELSIKLTIDEWTKRLLAMATAVERPVVEAVLRRLREELLREKI